MANSPLQREPPPKETRTSGGSDEGGACPNCGSLLSGAYCAACGQKVGSLREPLRRFIGDAFTEYFGLDGRLWQTLKLLLFRPGKLTVEYLEGRRARYLRPLRIYLSATILFFFLLTVLDPAERLRRTLDGGFAQDDTTMTVAQRQARIAELIEDDGEQLSAQIVLLDSLTTRFDSLLTAFEVDSVAAAIPDSLLDDREEELVKVRGDVEEEQRDLSSLREHNELRRSRFEWQTNVLEGYPGDSTILPTDLKDEAEVRFPDMDSDINISMPDWIPRSSSVQRLTDARTSKERSEAFAELGRSFIERLPLVMFLLLPVFALLLKIMYVRRKWYYSEHLVFGLHTHAFAFVVFTIMALLVGFSWGAQWSNTVSNIMTLILPVYFYFALKKVYKQGWIKTALKMWLLSSMYFIVLLCGFVLAATLAAAFG